MKLWCVIEDESTHDAEVNTVRSIWTTEELAKAECDRLNEPQWMWKCDRGCGYWEQDKKQDNEACTRRLLGGKMCNGFVSREELHSHSVVIVLTNQSLEPYIQL